jgi:REP element-mobilizing transposase RayT
LPLLTAELEPAVYACIQAECAKLNTEVLAVGGTENHLHVLVRLPTTVTLAALVQQMKGASSHLVTHELGYADGFKWQGAYAAFSVSKAQLSTVRDYILNQKTHHRDKIYTEEMELQPDGVD